MPPFSGVLTALQMIVVSTVDRAGPAGFVPGVGVDAGRGSGPPGCAADPHPGSNPPTCHAVPAPADE
jgi:hypothetical protein